MNKRFLWIWPWICRCMGGLTKVVLLSSVLPFAYAGVNTGIDKMPVPQNQMEAIRHGVTLYMEYCMGCHAAQSVTVDNLLTLGLSPDVLKAHGIDPNKGNAVLQALMPSASAQQAFGMVPPDLSQMEKQKSSISIAGSDWIYTYLRSFYQDTHSITGWNNLVFPHTKMPHILAGLQGTYVVELDPSHLPSSSLSVVRMKQVERGQLSTVEYDHAVADLVSYLGWMAEPTQHQRERLGVWVLLFLGVFAVLLWCLHAKYWKDVQ